MIDTRLRTRHGTANISASLCWFIYEGDARWLAYARRASRPDRRRYASPRVESRHFMRQQAFRSVVCRVPVVTA